MLGLTDADPMFLAALALGLVATGAVAGVLAGLLGVGGGIVIVPVLYSVLEALGVDDGVRMHVAVGTSLATIIPTAISSARAHARKGAVDRTLFRALAPGIFAGAVVGAGVAAIIGGRALGGVFGVVALMVAVDLVRPRPNTSADADRPPRLPARAALGALSAVIGAVSALMGIGGGTLTVPVLTYFGVAIHRAVATSAALGLVIALPAAAGYLIGGWGKPNLPPGNLGYVNLFGFVLIAAATFLTAPWGTRIAHAISATALRWVFALFLAVTAVRLLSRVIADQL
ncbi:MAG: sulfite exporter TauE/SafE family protein [Rhodospirillaceae bacterium]|nr:sulfite exporter TauE/SafE family protein [Rhodospirillaceae bacterium]